MYVRQPIATGIYYPRSKEAILKEIESKLETKEKENLTAILLPHLEYSKVIDFYIPLSKFEKSNFFILGPNHQNKSRFAIANESIWVTPLGEILVDERFKELLDEKIEVDMISHSKEYCIEIFLPLLQYLFGNDIKILPLLVKDENCVEDLLEVAEKIGNFLKKNEDFKVIATFNLFKGNEIVVKEMDEKILNSILKLDLEEFLNRIKEVGRFCGWATVTILIKALKILGVKKVKLEKHSIVQKNFDYQGCATLLFY
jgi:AmmeMemoRadiSam system protein B